MMEAKLTLMLFSTDAISWERLPLLPATMMMSTGLSVSVAWELDWAKPYMLGHNTLVTDPYDLNRGPSGQ